METPTERGRRLGRRYMVFGFGLFACLFMLSTTAQLVYGVFGIGARPLSTSADDGTQPTCAEELRGMQTAVDRAIAASAHARGDKEASRQYLEALLPEWSNGESSGDVSQGPPTRVEARCAKEIPGGTDALTAVVRLRMAGEQLARRHAAELLPLRSDVALYLPPSPPGATPQ
jgi:hypothetical protein